MFVQADVAVVSEFLLDDETHRHLQHFGRRVKKSECIEGACIVQVGSKAPWLLLLLLLLLLWV